MLFLFKGSLRKLNFCLHTTRDTFFLLFISCLLISPYTTHASSTVESVNKVYSIASGQTLVIPQTLNSDQFVVALATASHLEIKIEANSDSGKIIHHGQFKDLYSRQRLLITGEQCATCTIKIEGLGDMRNGEIRLEINTYTVSQAQLRLEAELQTQLAFDAKIGGIEGSYRTAFAHHFKATELWKSLGASREYRNSLYLTGDATAGFAREEARPDFFAQLLENAVADSDWFAAGMAKTALGRFHYRQGRFDQAKNLYQAALEYMPRLKPQNVFQKQYLAATVLHELGQLSAKTGSYAKSQEQFLKSLQHFNSAGDLLQVSEVLNSLGLLARNQNQLELASAYHQAAHKLSKDDSSGGIRMRTQYYMAVVSAIRGRYFYGLELLRDSEQLARRLRTEHWLGHILAAKARINLELGRFEQSKRLYAETQKQYEKVGASADLATVAYNLARLHSLIGNFELSKHNFEKSLKLSETTPNPDHYLNVKSAEVAAAIQQGELKNARVAQLELMDLAAESDNKFALGRNLTQLGEIHIELRNPEAAISPLKKAFDLHSEHQDDLYYAKSAYFLALALFQLKTPIEQSLEYLDTAIEVIENTRLTLARDDLRQQYFALQKSIYQLRTQILLGDRLNPQKYSLLSAETFKARTLYESMLRKSDDSQALPENHQFPRQRDTASGVAFQHREQNYLHIQDQILESAFKELNLESKTLSSTNNRLLTSEDLDRLRAEMDDDTAILYFFTGTEQSYLWLLSKTALEVRTIPALDELNAPIDNFLNEIGFSPAGQSGKQIWRSLHKTRVKLSNLVLGQISEHLDSYTNLIVVPDGPLHKIPFAALMHPDRQLLLLESHAISYASSLATNKWLSHSTNQKYQQGQMLMVANPQGRVTRLFAENRSKTRDESLKPLPFAQQEAESVSALWSTVGTTALLTGEEASKSRLYEHRLQDYEVIHFATHAIVDWNYPSLSAIALSNSDGPLEADLTVQEITQWDINAELVVLSGCETSAGSEITGEGPIGLSRAFFEAGAKRMLATLWSVEDEASAHITREFYRALTVDGLPPAKALRVAQLQISSVPKWSHPYFWAGFVFIGNREAWRDV